MKQPPCILSHQGFYACTKSMGEVPHILKGSRHGHKQKTHTHYIEKERKKEKKKKDFMWFLDYVHIETIEGRKLIKNCY